MEKLNKYFGYIYSGLVIIAIFVPSLSFAKDFSQSVGSLKGEISNLLMYVAPTALMVASFAFFFSKQLGMMLLGSTTIGIVLFSSSDALFNLLHRVFN